MRFSIFTLTILLCAFCANAANIDGIKFSGEASFDYSFLSSKQNTIPAIGAATNESYRLNQVQIVAAKETEQLSFIGRVIYSPTAAVVQSGTPDTKNYSNLGPLDQLEIFYKVTPELSIGFGRLYTTMGYESFLRSENPTYGNSIASQTIVPLNGEGLRVKYVTGDRLTATVTSYNQSAFNSSQSTATPTKTTEASATGTLGDFAWFVSYYFGQDPAVAPGTSTTDKSASSIWTSYKFTPNFMAALAYDSKGFQPHGSHNHWSASTGIVLSYGLGINNLALRYEMVHGANELTDIATGKTYGTADKVNSLTITDKLALNENFKLFFEYKFDQADENVFLDQDGIGKKDASLATIGAVAHF